MRSFVFALLLLALPAALCGCPPAHSFAPVETGGR